MAGKALGQPGSSSKSGGEEKDPLEEAQKFTKQMAAKSIIESEVEKSKASAEKAKAEAEEAKARARRAESGEGEGRVKPPVDISGSIKLGNIDYGEIVQKAEAERDRLREQAEEQARTQAGVNEDLRRELHEKEMQVLKISFEAQMQVLTKMIESNASRGSFMDQYNATIEMAKTLGFSQPTTGGDLTTQIELKKMEFEQTRELRRLAREDKQADREFQRQLNRDAREAKRDEQEAERQVKRDEMFASFPQRIGGAIAKGMVESGEGGGVSERPGGKSYHIEVGSGESGEVECPSCGKSIGIGPTARSAVCAGCGTRFTVKRTEAEAPAEEE